MKFAIRACILGAALIASGQACSSEPTPVIGAGCALSSDCKGNLVCIRDRCHAQCSSSKDCRDEDHPMGRCVKAHPGPRESDAALSSDAGYATPEELICLIPPGTPGGGQDTQCTYPSECPAGLTCAVDRQCRNQCLRDRDCIRSSVLMQQCTDGFCRDPDEPTCGGHLCPPGGAHGDGGTGAHGGSGNGGAGGSSRDAGNAGGGGTSSGGAGAATAGSSGSGGVRDAGSAATPSKGGRSGAANYDGGVGQDGGGNQHWVIDVAVFKHQSDGGLLVQTADSNFACVVVNDGSVWCWGSNAAGQLGDGTLADRSYPVQVHSDKGEFLNDVAEVKVGWSFACARTKHGNVLCWGSNDSGQLGDGTFVSRPVAKEVVGFDGRGVLSDVVQLALQEGSACVRKNDGSVNCWGTNSNSWGTGQIGDGTSVNSALPKLIRAMDVIDIRSGADDTCASTNQGEFLCWGGNGWPNFPSPLSSSQDGGYVSHVLQFDVGTARVCASATDPFIHCWNSPTQLYGGPNLGHFTSSTVSWSKAAGMASVASMSLGWNHACAIASSGVTYCWGDNTFGQLGDSTTKNELNPTPIYEHTFASVAAGANFTCGIETSGSVWCWGRNDKHELGNTDYAVSSTPLIVNGIGCTPTSQNASAKCSGGTINLAADGSAMPVSTCVRANKSAAHAYSTFIIDTKDVSTGGTLKVDLSLGNGMSAASYDLYNRCQPIPLTGSSPPSLAHAYDVAPGSMTTTLTAPFLPGDMFQLAIEGSSMSAAGTTNDVDIKVSTEASN